MTDFRFVALPKEPFAPLFDTTDAELSELGARRVVARAKPGYPCRVSLEDAEPGETVLMSLRAYGAEGMMVACDVMEGKDLEAAIRRMFEDEGVKYLHAHNAKPGCYAAAVVRA